MSTAIVKVHDGNIVPAQMSNEDLGEYVANESVGVLTRLDILRPYFEELWKRFDELPKDGTINGCATKTEFCEKILHRSRRGVNYILHGRPATTTPLQRTESLPTDTDRTIIHLIQNDTGHIQAAYCGAVGIPKNLLRPWEFATKVTCERCVKIHADILALCGACHSRDCHPHYSCLGDYKNDELERRRSAFKKTFPDYADKSNEEVDAAISERYSNPESVNPNFNRPGTRRKIYEDDQARRRAAAPEVKESDDIKKFRSRYFNLVNNQLEPAGFAPSGEIKNSEKMQLLAQKMFGVDTLKEMNSEQWETYLSTLEEKLEKDGASEVIKYIETIGLEPSGDAPPQSPADSTPAMIAAVESTDTEEDAPPQPPAQVVPGGTTLSETFYVIRRKSDGAFYVDEYADGINADKDSFEKIALHRAEKFPERELPEKDEDLYRIDGWDWVKVEASYKLTAVTPTETEAAS